MTTQPLTAADILAMPLTELRERVELAERLALAARHAGSSSSAGGSASVASPTGGKDTSAQSGAAGKGAQATAAKNPPAATTPKPAATTPAATAPADDDLSALDNGGTDAGNATASGDDDLTFGGGDGDDMLAGFTESVTPEEAKTKTVAIAKQVIAKKENSELAIAREIMQKYGVTKVSEVAAGKEVDLYNDFKAGFPQYAG